MYGEFTMKRNSKVILKKFYVRVGSRTKESVVRVNCRQGICKLVMEMKRLRVK